MAPSRQGRRFPTELVPGCRDTEGVTLSIPEALRGQMGERVKTIHGTLREYYPSMSALVNRLTMTERHPCNENATSSTDNQARDTWDLNTGYDGALALASAGWRDPMSTVRDIADTVKSSIGNAVVPVRERVRTFQGTRLHMASYLGGDPRCAIGIKRSMREGASPIIRIVANLSTSCGISGPAMVKRGATLAALVEVLQSAGWSVQVEVINHCVEMGQIGDQAVTHTLRVKDSDQPMDTADMLFALAHPAFFRRLCFGLMERGSVYVPGGYGAVSSDLPSDLKGDVTLGAGAHLSETDMQANPVRWVLRQIEGLGLLKQ